MPITLGLLEAAGVSALGAFLTTAATTMDFKTALFAAAGAAGLALAYGGVSSHLTPSDASAPKSS